MAGLVEIRIPDIGDFKDVPVIEVMVKTGDKVEIDDPLITLESDKAIMDVPAPHAGVIKEVKVKLGDKVSEGSPIVVIESEEGAAVGERPPPAQLHDSPPPDQSEPTRVSPALARMSETAIQPPPAEATVARKPLASPLARRFARELGVDISRVEGGGTSGRILKADVQKFVKGEFARLADAAAGNPGAASLSLPPWPKVDFAKFGPVEVKPLSRIRKLAGSNLARNWVMIPHVTHFDEADVTELEEFRRQLNEGRAAEGVKLTILAFVLKACVAALGEFPEFNASLEGGGLVLKRYFHLGVAVDTADGLIVPVLRDADRKGVLEIANEIAELSASARAGKLKITDIQGGSFTVSNLGGFGGTAFTPIINAPEVAILGLSTAALKPVYRDGALAPRLIMPVSLSYDHRVIDGAMAARFTSYLCAILRDLRRALL
ncbi:MAG: dihydrolipoyllysine-residue acetyltransferase [Candidatus Binataceae bacterium]